MSIRVMTAVWDSGAYDGCSLLVLLALADWSKDDGTKIFPTIRQIMEKARLSERGARDCMRKLREDGVVVLVAAADGTPGRANEWRIDLRRLSEVAGLHALDKRGASDGGKVCPPAPEHQENNGSDTVQPVVSQPTAGDASAASPQGERVHQSAPVAEGTGANDDADGGKCQPERGQIEAGTGANGSTSPTPPNIDQPSLPTVIQPSSLSSLRAREPECPKVETIPDHLRRGPEGFEEFIRLGWHPNTRRAEALDAMRTDGVPSLADLTAAAKRYHDGLSRGRKHDPAFAVTAAKFIREEMWRDFPPPAPAVTTQAPPATEVWSGHAAADTLRDELGEAIFNTYLAPCQLNVVEGIAVLIAPSKFIADRISDKYADRLDAAFGGSVTVGYARNSSEAAA